MQALSASANAMLQVSQDGVTVADVEAVPKVWHGLTILHEQSTHIKVGFNYHLNQLPEELCMGATLVIDSKQWLGDILTPSPASRSTDILPSVPVPLCTL